MDGDRSRDQHPNNVVFWRLSALEEAMKFSDTQVVELRNRIDRQPEELGRVFPTKLDVEQTYVRRDELRVVAGDRRDAWTLRFLAIGTSGSLIVGVISLLHSFSH